MAPGSSVALDQWRGPALLLVLISHGFYLTDRVYGAGRVGVNLFFFIFGLLVYSSLAKRGDGGAFWWRRGKRLRTYSIYLWRQPLTICGYPPSALHPFGALASTAVGALSFRWFERPFLSPSRRSERPQEPLSSPAEWASSSA